MKIRNILLLMVLAIGTNVVIAQNGNQEYVELYKRELARQDSLSKELKRLKFCRDSLWDIITERNSKLSREIHNMESELVRKKNELEKLRSSGDYKKMEQLKKTVSDLKKEIKMLDAENDTLQKQIRAQEDQLIQLRSKVNELESVKSGFEQELFEKYNPILKKKYSEMSVEELDEIINECNKYSDSKAIKELLQSAESIKEDKLRYDKAVKALNEGCNYRELADIKKQLNQIVTSINEQRKERDEVKKKIVLYQPAVDTFKEFINNLNSRDRTNYDADDLDRNWKRVLNTVDPDTKIDLKTKIDQTIMQIPYLKKAYDNYYNELRKRPSSHPPIEGVILNWSELKSK